MMNEVCLKSYKDFVREAKFRMHTNGYSSINNVKNATGGKTYVVNSKVIEGEELYSYYLKIKELVLGEGSLYAIGELIDRELYASLSQAERERYVLELAALYRDMKERCLKENHG